jgi:arylsulfatase A-like enzyme
MKPMNQLYRKAVVASMTLLTSQLIVSGAEKPNIVYILTDDLGFGDVKVNNPEGKIPTPYLDEFASEGMNFTDAHTNSSVCTPTRYGILTGRYCWRTPLKSKVLDGYSDALIEDDRTTVGDYLQQQGYDTALIGKWHLGWNWALKEGVTRDGFKKKGVRSSAANAQTVDFAKPITKGPNTNGGFQYYFAASASLDFPPYVYVENDQPLSVPTKTTAGKGWRKGLTADDFKHVESTPEYMKRSIAYIKQRSKNPKPFFLYIPLPSPHTPIVPTDAFKGKSGLNTYADFVMQVDWTAGQIIKAVDDAGIAENTIVIFTSDNGCSPRAKISDLMKKGHDPHAGLKGMKSDIWEGGHRVPFMVRWPKRIKAGQTNSNLVGVTDLLATMADVCRVPLKESEGEDSISMLPTLLDAQQATRDTYVVHSVNGKFGIRQGDWIYIDTQGSGGWSKSTDKSPVQLYNLKEDLAQQKNVYREHPEKVKGMKALLEKYKNQGHSRED